MENKILTKLPTKIRDGKHIIIWGKIYETTVKVRYKNEEYSIFIMKNNDRRGYINAVVCDEFGSYNDENIKTILTKHFKDLKLGNIINDKYGYKYIVGEIINAKKSSYKILEHSRTNGCKSYTVKCLRCGHIRRDYLEAEVGKHSCGKCINGFRLNVGDNFKSDKVDIVITDRFFEDVKTKTGNRKWRKYKYVCNKCGYSEGVIEELKLVKYNRGCPCCCPNPQIVVPDINSIKAKTPWMIGLGVSMEDSVKYTPRSNKKISVICPNCGITKDNVTIDNINKNKSISCICGDGVSYPEKFIYSMLKQLNLKFETQYSPKYLNKKRSDFYIPSLNLVIEADGRIGHEGGIVHSKSNKTIEECIITDKWKDEQYKLNGVDIIRIDCFESDMEYIKNSILNSKLNKLCNLSNINWLQCEEYALRNIVKDVCEVWNNKNEFETVTDISNKFDLNKATIREYLKKGTRLSWCNYDAKEELKKTLFKPVC